MKDRRIVYSVSYDGESVGISIDRSVIPVTIVEALRAQDEATTAQPYYYLNYNPQIGASVSCVCGDGCYIDTDIALTLDQRLGLELIMAVLDMM